MYRKREYIREKTNMYEIMGLFRNEIIGGDKK